MESPTQDQTCNVSTGQRYHRDSSSDDQSPGKTKKIDVDVNLTASDLTTGENSIDVIYSRIETKITNCKDDSVIDNVNAPGGVVNIHGNTSNQGSTNIEVVGMKGGSSETVTLIGLQNVNCLKVKNQTVAVQHIHGDRSSPLDNIVEDTWHCIKAADPKKHVSTYAEGSARRLLKQSGAIFIKGISGSGKSRLSLNLLAAIAKDEQRLPILLSSSKQWDYIPKKSNEKQKISSCASGSDQEVHRTVKYIVMIDDIFGSSNLVQSYVDEWVKLFDIMLPYLESGKMKLVITSRPEIIRQCERQIKKYRLMKNMTSFALHEDRYGLRKTEKIKMVKTICGHVQKFTKFELDTIACMNISLGFPQCCHFFAGSRQAQEKGISFFQKPKAFVFEEVERLEHCDGVGHLVLLIVLMKNGCLAKNILSLEAYSNDLKPLLEKVQECCHNMPSSLTQADIRKKADSFCGVYLICTGKGYEFQHQSIHDCVFANVSQNYPELTIDLCPVEMLLELVRTQEADTDGVTVCLEEEHYDLLAKRMTKLLLSENYENILAHPSLHHDQFVGFLLKKWKSENKVEDIIKYKHEPKTVYVNIFSIFDYTYLSEDIILRKLGLLTKGLIKDSEIKDRSLLSCLLVCAVYIGDNILVQHLLKMGAETSMSCYRAMFHAKGIDKTVSDKMLLKCPLGAMADLDDLFSMAVQKGNIHVVELVVTRVKGSRNVGNMCRNNLRLLLKGMTENCSPYSNQLKNDVKLCVDPATLSKLIQLLYGSSEPKDDVNYLVGLSASHKNATALKVFLTCPCINLHKKTDIKVTAPFETALAHGGTDCVEELIRYHARSGGSVEELVNQKTDKRNGFTYPLHVAAEYGKAENMKLLIQNGANVNLKDSDDQTALCVSTTNRHDDCVKVLLQANALVTEKDKYGQIPFARLYERFSSRRFMDSFMHSKGFVSYKSLVSIVKCFENSGCDINVRDSKGRSCISKAVLCQDRETVKFLCEKGVSVDEMNDQGNTLLQIASKQLDMDIVELLSTMGAKTDIVNNEGKSVIHMAAASNTDAIDKIQYFLDDKGVHVATLDNQGRTALFDAVKSGDMEVVELLEERGLDMKHRDNSGKTLLHVAWESTRSLDVIKMVIDAGVKPEDVDDEGNTALHSFIKYLTWIHIKGLKEVIELLAENKVLLNARNIAGETPLHLAYFNISSVFAVEILLQIGADPCVTNNLGNTPLHLAAHIPLNQSLIDLLIQNGTDPNVKNQDGRTPLHCAADKGCSSTMERLLLNGADPCVTDNLGNTPLHVAAGCDCSLHIFHRRRANDTSLIDLLIQNGADPNSKTPDGRTPLHCASDKSCSVIVNALLECGADPCVTDNSGNTPISLAKGRGKPDIEQILLKKKAGLDSTGNG